MHLIDAFTGSVWRTKATSEFQRRICKEEPHYRNGVDKRTPQMGIWRKVCLWDVWQHIQLGVGWGGCVPSAVSDYPCFSHSEVSSGMESRSCTHTAGTLGRDWGFFQLGFLFWKQLKQKAEMVLISAGSCSGAGHADRGATSQPLSWFETAAPCTLALVCAGWGSGRGFFKTGINIWQYWEKWFLLPAPFL